ncbi:spore germination protein [Paenibacillus mucilaginosus]|uniref:Spore germination protein KA n=2 Tax=Paenibacillus mucilaginosus TaxID=61624 RepID=I0BIH1_9BACL|nr:spore germination protein [Paenibacillus mucilaginosus]AEI41443.1 germination protein [Paenibacillus mucilaginosus KNP414]AFH62168.1 spore germination protein KA [Paenibacillus mucilaginosus K02]MCG7217572.1 spore germination protein [Paenibacillus mucilaginosus]WDM30454.1 spore germination protein [Paenibacillus mucilaginosus]WFA18638.1 spore germination protein [Paenibacillus mucilaginosus]
MIALSASLAQNLHEIEEYMGHSADLCVRRFELSPGREAAVLYLASLVDKALIDEFVMQPMLESGKPEEGTAEKVELPVHLQQTVSSVEKAASALLQGCSLVLVDGLSAAKSGLTSGGERRAVSEPSAESVVRGPRESFNESLLTNIGLIRRRLASPHLRTERLMIGSVTNTPVSILYLEGTAKEEYVTEVKERLGSIRLDGILESQYLEEYLEEKQGYTPFPTVFNTERPDRVAAGLLEGRVAVLMEGTPVALVVPATIGLFLYSNEDYYQRYDIATFLRILRTFTFLISIAMPGFYVALLTYHQEMIPTPLLVALTGQREGVPFGIAIEVFLMEMTFEILREAGIRLPKTIGSAVSIVGGLVLGQAAVEAGLVAPGTVIAVSVTAISSFCTPAFNIAISARLIRFVLILLCAALGAFGLFFGLILTVIHLNTLRSLGVPYLSPISPFHGKDWRDLFIRAPLRRMTQHPEELRTREEGGERG